MKYTVKFAGLVKVVEQIETITLNNVEEALERNDKRLMKIMLKEVQKKQKIARENNCKEMFDKYLQAEAKLLAKLN